MTPDAHLLVVDQDAQMRTILLRYLMRGGFLTSGARDADHATRLLHGLEFDLIITDDSGLIKTIREAGDTPILLLHPDNGTDEANDYLPKPFEPQELLLRIRALLNLNGNQSEAAQIPKMLHMGAIRYDISKGTLWAGEDALRLTATETKLMKIFAKQPSTAISRATLVEKLGRSTGQAQERATDVQITRLRRKIEENPKQPRYLLTVRGAGYMLRPD